MWRGRSADEIKKLGQELIVRGGEVRTGGGHLVLSLPAGSKYQLGDPNILELCDSGTYAR